MTSSPSVPRNQTRKRIHYPWEVCILATSTPTSLQHHTLRVLHQSGIPASKLTIFVQGNEEKTVFQNILPRTNYKQIVASPDFGLSGLLRCVYSHYALGTPLIVCRDSIEQILDHTGSSKACRLKSLIPVFQTGFSLCAHEKVGLWGIHPRSQASRTTPKVSVSKGIQSISGGLWGIHNPGIQPQCMPTYNTIPEYQSVLQFSKLYGTILRLNSLTVLWKSDKGSKQREYELERLEHQYPESVVLFTGSSGCLEVRFIQDKDEAQGPI